MTFLSSVTSLRGETNMQLPLIQANLSDQSVLLELAVIMPFA